MKNTLLIVPCLLFALIGVAQNLVPNPSFEEYNECPTSLGQIEKASGWFSARPTPDYFNFCSSGQSSVPNNYWGHQLPMSGFGYAGFTAYQADNVREVIGIELSQPLSIGSKYYVSMHVSLYNSAMNMLASNGIGAAFSTVQHIAFVNQIPVANQSLIYEQNIISDTANWVRISGSFISDSAYRFVYFGNLFDDESTDHVEIHPFGGRSYYFIDEVCVSFDSLSCSGLTSNQSIDHDRYLNTFPLPFEDYFLIDTNLDLSDALINIYDITGRAVAFHFDRDSHKVSFNIGCLSRGMYILRISNLKFTLTRQLIH